ncbi:unnamed protein product [Trypanosoma congolense IL3000]|uniref:WGS project CAEQ00000000 data, annotated contig 1432 n=1 Tax=Trypanosoma congolense (strain IL3000) TaxID=1068625 RepID=F9W681_TRYCI|nr:unnamed protein product [Trypanosoma congolense IL3000]
MFSLSFSLGKKGIAVVQQVRMRGFSCVVSLWVVVLVSGRASGNNGDGVCKLNENAAGLLCAIAKLMEKAHQITETHDYKDIDGTWGNVELHKDQVEARTKTLQTEIEAAKHKGTLTDEDGKRLTNVSLDAQDKTLEEHKKAENAIKAHNGTHSDAKSSTSKALGGTRVEGNCHSTASLLGIIQCYVKGETPQGDVKIETLCNGKDYQRHLSEHFGESIANCNGIGKRKTYCNGTGSALKAVLKRWNTTDKTKADSGGTCAVKGDWEKHALNASDQMHQLDKNVQTIHEANLLTTSYLSIIHQMQEDVKNGKHMKEIVANARKAGQEGAKVVVEKQDDNTGDGTEKQSGKTASPVEEEVKVTVQLDGLKFDEENMPAHSKETFPKFYIYLLAILLPLCCLVIGVTMFCILRRVRSTHAEKSIPVDGATMNKVGGTHAQF